MYQVVYYTHASGRCPFDNWFRGLRDKVIQARILNRLHQVEAGNLGDFAPVGEGVSEFRFHFGPGYRIYWGQWEGRLVILLCGGDKGSQAKDIERAKGMWSDWKRRHP